MSTAIAVMVTLLVIVIFHDFFLYLLEFFAPVIAVWVWATQ
jgi:hypothetical protein